MRRTRASIASRVGRRATRDARRPASLDREEALCDVVYLCRIERVGFYVQSSRARCVVVVRAPIGRRPSRSGTRVEGSTPRARC